MNPVKALETHGQAVWLDFLARGFTARGDLKALIDNEGLKGVTSNPSIFEKAIGSSDEYDAPIGKALAKRDLPVAELFERLAVEDIQSAADVLRPVYDHLDGADGFVSLEVSPYLAADTKGTIAEAERLWKDVKRKNLMVKVPATDEGLPAIEHLIGEGINVNITLLFSQQVYLRVVEAYLAGLEKFVAKGGDPSRIASVASFFVSRIDSVVDKKLDEKIAQANDPLEKVRLAALRGRVAIANAKLAYQHYKRLFSGARWDKLAAKDAKPQRLLWASTGTKNKTYSDVLYVEELIGPNTVNTMPPATLEAFRDHGRPRNSLEENIHDAEHALAELGQTGISLDDITAELVEDGVKLFADAADKLLGAVAHKRATVLGTGLDRQEMSLANGIGKAVAKAAEQWRASAKAQALAARHIGMDRPRRGQVARLAGEPRRRRYRRLRGFRQAGEGTEVFRCGRARYGWIEPRAGGAGEDLCHEIRLSKTACAGLDRPGAGAPPRREDRHRPHAVHRVLEVGRHHRAERDEGLFFRARQ
jgi:transaldolase/glucose-6-phosphate isomerase